jgi:hypothetical protein
MDKYIALFSTPAETMQQWMATTDEATRKAQMDQMMSDWKTWAEAHKDAIVDQGTGLGKTKRVSKEGVTDTKNDLNYSMVVQAESHEAAAQMFVENPHLQMIPNSYVQVMGTMGPAEEM